MESLTHGCTRREVVHLLAAGTVSVFGCTLLGGADADDSARLTTRLGTPSQQLTPGLRTLGLDSTHHDARLLIPASYVAGTPTPFVLALHGAGGSAAGPIGWLSRTASFCSRWIRTGVPGTRSADRTAPMCGSSTGRCATCSIGVQPIRLAS
jgi:hypothetical protein